MKIPIRVPLALALLLAGARLASANCDKDDPTGSMRAAAREAAETACGPCATAPDQHERWGLNLWNR